MYGLHLYAPTEPVQTLPVQFYNKTSLLLVPFSLSHEEDRGYQLSLFDLLSHVRPREVFVDSLFYSLCLVYTGEIVVHPGLGIAVCFSPRVNGTNGTSSTQYVMLRQRYLDRRVTFSTHSLSTTSPATEVVARYSLRYTVGATMPS